MRAAALLCAVLAAACSSSEPMSDWERRNPELLTDQEAKAPTPPAMPRRENLIEFYVGPQATLRYFVDGASLSVNYKQKEVRYVLFARSPSGAENVTYEAIKCPDMHRIYAVGEPGGKWSVRPGEWREIQRRTGLGTPGVLAREYFCPHRDPLQSADEGVDALRRGGHPLVYTEPRPLGR